MSVGTEESGKDAKDLAAGAAPPAPRSPSEGPQTEWTVSDHRGPLRAPSSASAPKDDIERVVPGSETDAEGAHDAGAPSSPMEAGAALPHTAHGADLQGAEPHVEATPAESDGGLVPAARSEADPPPGSGFRPEAPARRSLWPAVRGVIAGLVGGLIGVGIAALIYSQRSEPAAPGIPPAISQKLAELSSRLDGVEKRGDPQAEINAVKGRLSDVAGRVAVLEKRPLPAASPVSAPQPPVSQAPVSPTPASQPPASAAPASATAAPQQPVGKPPAPQPVASQPSASPTSPAQPDAADAALAAKVAALQASLDTLGKQSGSRDAAVKELTGKLDALQATLVGVQAAAVAARSNADAVKGQQHDLDGKLGALQAAVSGAQKQATSVQSDLASVQSEQKTLAGRVGAPALAVAADSLVAQIEGGKPFATQVDALTTLGADPAKVAVLRENAGKGVPSAQALLAKFAPLADPVIATGSKAPANADFGDRLKHGLFGLVNVRRADETTGNDLSSRVALIQADLAHGDVVGAYAVWTALPADAKAKSDAWGSLAKTSVEAITAARGLQAESIGSLAAKKS